MNTMMCRVLFHLLFSVSLFSATAVATMHSHSTTNESEGKVNKVEFGRRGPNSIAVLETDLTNDEE